eukprot:jgi/Astpho2/9304/fgenesh1_pg.00139_%23_25_t
MSHQLRPSVHCHRVYTAMDTAQEAAKSTWQPPERALFTDHPILVERTTRLQQPLQYEREYVAETRLTGRRRAADGQPVADEVLRSAEEHLEEGQGGGSSLRGVPDQYQGFFKAGPLESPRPPDHMQSDVLVTPEIEVEVPMETSSAPRLADVWVRVPAAAAPAPAVAEERVRIAVRQRPPEVIDDEDQSPRCDIAAVSVYVFMPAYQLLVAAQRLVAAEHWLHKRRYDPAALKFGPAVYIAELLPAGQRADALQPLGHDRSDTARIEADVLGAVRQRASAGSGLGKQPLAEPCAPITSGPLGVATPVSPPLASTGVGASTSRAPPTAMRVPAPAAVRVQVPQRERRESVRLFLGDPDNSPRYDPAARRHGEDVYPVLATGVPVAADSPKPPSGGELPLCLCALRHSSCGAVQKLGAFWVPALVVCMLWHWAKCNKLEGVQQIRCTCSGQMQLNPSWHASLWQLTHTTRVKGLSAMPWQAAKLSW